MRRLAFVRLFYIPLAAVFIFALPAALFAETRTYSSPGTYSFTVPSYSTMTVRVWGAGGGGGAVGFLSSNGLAGTASRFNGPTVLIANGGQGGQSDQSGTSSSGAGGAGGGASGGSTNTTGGAGVSGSSNIGGRGGNAPSGGSGGAGGVYYAHGSSGGSPGGGGGGGACTSICGGAVAVSNAVFAGGGGGAGGYASRTFSPATLSPGSVVTIVVGRGGSGGSAPNDVDSDAGYFYNGGAGAHGRVVIEWTADACPTPLETVAGGLGFRLAAGIADRKLNKHGTNACVSNSGTLTYFIPARTSAELQSFMNAISRLFGVQAN